MPRGSGSSCRENRKHILDEKSSAESSSEDSISTLFGILSSDDDSRSTFQANGDESQVAERYICVIMPG